jgi:uncharacterized membrane protein YdjX (TVP38/TMEM64 family)
MTGPRPITLVRVLVIAAFLAILSYALFFADWRPRDMGDVRADLLLIGPQAPFTAALFQAILTILLVPGFLLILATAILFGYDSIWISFLGQTGPALASYWLARSVGHEFVRALLGQRLLPLQRILEAHAFRYLLLLRMLGFVPLPLLTYGPGFLRVPFRTFLVATIIGEMPLILVLGFFAERLHDLREPRDALQPQFILPAVVLVLLLLVPVVIAFLRRRPASTNEKAPPGANGAPRV